MLSFKRSLNLAALYGRRYLLPLRADRAALRDEIERTFPQYTPAEWHGWLGGGVQANAMLDRLVHGSVRIEPGDVNVRKLLAKRRGVTLQHNGRSLNGVSTDAQTVKRLVFTP